MRGIIFNSFINEGFLKEDYTWLIWEIGHCNWNQFLRVKMVWDVAGNLARAHSCNCSVQSISRVWLFATPWIAQSCPTLCDARPPCPSSTPGVHSNSHPWSQWCHLAISSSVVPFSSCPQFLPASESFPKSQLWHQSFQRTPRTDLLENGLVGSPCSPRDSQESSPTPQFNSIDCLVLSCLHSPTLTSIHDHWKNRSLD